MANLTGMDIIEAVGEGGLIEDIDEACKTVIAAVDLTATTGRVTVQLDFKPVERGRITVYGQVKIKEPQLQMRSKALWVAGAEGDELSEDNPNQPDLPLEIMRTAEDMRPKKGSGIDSVTISTPDGKSATLEAR